MRIVRRTIILHLIQLTPVSHVTNISHLIQSTLVSHVTNIWTILMLSSTMVPCVPVAIHIQSVVKPNFLWRLTGTINLSFGEHPLYILSSIANDSGRCQLHSPSCTRHLKWAVSKNMTHNICMPFWRMTMLLIVVKILPSWQGMVPIALVTMLPALGLNRNFVISIFCFHATAIFSLVYSSLASVTTMSNSRSYPVTPVTSQYSSPTPVAHIYSGHGRCHTPNVFGTVDMEKVSWWN